VTAIEAANHLRGLRTWRGLTEILFQPVGQLAVPFGALFSRDRLYGGAKCSLVTLASSAHEVYEEICAGHNEHGVNDLFKYIDGPSPDIRCRSFYCQCFHDRPVLLVQHGRQTIKRRSTAIADIAQGMAKWLQASGSLSGPLSRHESKIVAATRSAAAL